VFKLFKSKAAGMKNISKKTVTLLDGEDLDALMHLTEEFPEVSRSMDLYAHMTAGTIGRSEPDILLAFLRF
jgi:hypothetical protein